MSSSSVSHELPASSSCPLFMSYEANLDVQQQIKQTAAYLDLVSVPDSFAQTHSGIPLLGTVPLSMQHRLGDNFSSAEVEIAKKQSETDASVSIRMASPQALRAVEIISDAQEVEFGKNKNFMVRGYHGKRPIGKMPFETLAYLLDNVIPTSDTGELSKLAEERFALPFDVIAVRMGDVLGARAKRTHRISTYVAHTLLGGDAFHQDGQLDTLADRLSVTSKGPVTTYKLECFESLPIGGGFGAQEFGADASDVRPLREGNVVKNVRYEFTERNYRERSSERSRKNLDAEVSVSLLSRDFDKLVLTRLLDGAQEDFDGPRILGRTLESIQASRPQVTPT